MFANGAKLMYAGKASQDGMITDSDMPGNRGTIGHHDMITENTVVGDMDIRHEEVVITDTSHTTSTFRAAVDGGKFANRIAFANLESGALTGIFKILGIFTHGGKLEYSVSLANRGGPFKYHMRPYPAASTNGDLWTDYGIRADFNIISNAGGGIDNSCCVNQSSISFFAIRTSAEQHSTPSTVAFPSKRQMPRFSFSTVTSKWSRSPGVT